MKTHRSIVVAALLVFSMSLQAQNNTAKPAQTEMQKWLADLDADWQATFKREVSDPFSAELDILRIQYRASIQAGITKVSDAGDLDGALALRAEQKRFSETNDVPAQDDAAELLPVKQLRAGWRAQIARMEKDRAARAKAVQAKYDQVLAQAQTALAQHQRLDDALLVKARRDEVATTWPPPPPAVTAENPSPTTTPKPPATEGAKPATPVTKAPIAPKPGVPLTPPASPQSGVIEVAAQIGAKANVMGVAPGAVVFDGPRGDGRGGAKGVLLKNDPLTGKNGSTWSFNYTRKGSDTGIFVIHPHGSGQMISRISRAGVRVSTPGSWYEVGYGGGDSKGVTKARGFDEVFPLKDGEMYQVVSRLAGQGGYELTIDGKLVATAQVTVTSPLSLEKKSGGSDFKGNELPLRWAAGYAAVLVGPRDQGLNVCREIRFWPAVHK